MNIRDSGLSEKDVRKIVREEIEISNVEIEELNYDVLSEREKLELAEAKEQYRKGEVDSFDDVYKEVMDE